MLSDPTHLPNRDVVFDELGDTGVPVMDWFYDRTQGNTHVSGGDMTRAKTSWRSRSATTTAACASTGSSSGRPSGRREPTRSTRSSASSTAPARRPRRRPGRPTAAGSRWANAEGLQVVTVQPFPAGCDVSRAQPTSTLLVAGASQPDWGPADVPAARPPRADPPSTPGTDPGRTPGTNPRTPGTNPRTPGTKPAANALAAKATASTRGVTVKLTAPAAGRVSARASVKGKTVARVTRSVRRGGAVAVTLRFKRALRKGTAVKLKLSFKPARGAGRSVSLNAKVR